MGPINTHIYMNTHLSWRASCHLKSDECAMAENRERMGFINTHIHTNTIPVGEQAAREE
jgi:hypothetical protein